MIGLLKNLKLMKKNKFISYSRKPPRTLDIICQLRHSRNGLNFLVSLLTYLLGIFPSLVYALPIDGTVQAGSATISQVSGSQVNISQSSNKSIIDWNSFSIASGEQVNFQVPSSTSVTLNRVTGNDPSSIFGNLTSNGHLMLINRNGILFGSGSEIDVHGLVATTSDISNHDFINGQYRFNISPEFSNTINNQGTITAAEGGLVAFVAPGIKNTGTINARLGKVSLAAGNTFTLDLYGDQLVNLGVDSQVIQQVTGFNGDELNSLVSNSGSIYADGGVVTMDVQVAQSLIDNVVNMSGYIQARSIAEKNGAIYLTGGNEGLVKVSGSIDATGLNIKETGGIVHVLGNRVGLYDYALIDVSGDAGGGLILVGGDYQGLGSIPTAVENYVGPNVSIFADAVTGGNGGRTIFWADRRTEFFGTIRSRGGRFFGDGGFAEVSGKEELYFDGSVDTTAPNGKSGT
ncbi:MAG: two-partner secretion domain-containing protein, partial [Nitrospinaceae bacterium]